MFLASLYIIGCTARNRLLVRLRRLREPRYLVGAIVGAAYIYFSFFARFRASGASVARRRARGTSVSADPFTVIGAAGPAVLGLGLMVLTALAWMLPFGSGLLDFSASEVQFLFTAPVSRRSLLLHRLTRSQLGILFGSLIAALVAPSTSGFSRLRVSIGVWLILSTGKVFFTGVTLARARLLSADSRSRRVARLPLAAMIAALVVVGSALYQRIAAGPAAVPRDVIAHIAAVSTTGVPAVVMWPFTALARPLFAPWPGPFLTSVAMALLILIGVTAWVLQSSAAFEEATEEVSGSTDRSTTSARARYRVRASGWTLGEAGRPEVIFAWKAAMQTFRLVDVRVLIRVVAFVFAVSVVAVSVGQRNGVVAALAMFAMTASVFSILFGPQVIRVDVRQDLQHLELLKTWPLRAADVVRGEMLWPGAMISALAGIAIALATILSGALFTRAGAPLRISLGVASAILAPGLAFAQLAIHNGLALLFPAWVTLGAQRARGLDAMGQRIITLAGTWLALIALALPGAVAGGIVWFVLRLFVGYAALVPAAIVCSGLLLVEVLVITELLGPAYERLDLTAVERAE